MAEAKAFVIIPKSDKKATEIVLDMYPLVLCKDCKYVCFCDSTEIIPNIPVYAKCTLTGIVHEPDWFCADGEKAVKWK